MSRCILYRILGNDLPPRHCSGQSLSDLRFILEHEPDLPGLEKRWLINRVIDVSLAERMRQEIAAAGYRVDTIPFHAADYKSIWTDVGELPVDHHPWSAQAKSMNAKLKARIGDYVARHKNQYLMNNNGARNFALQLALKDAEWGMPWDGGCFLSLKAWDMIQSVMTLAGLGYVAVPMSRIDRNARLVSNPDLVPIANYEPQLCFSRQARHHFDPRLRYGSMPKASLLRRLAVPGEWHEWNKGILPWEKVDYSLLDQAGSVVQVGWVFRLNQPEPDPLHTKESHLHGLRFGGITQFIRETDKSLIAEALHGRELLFWTALQEPSNHASLAAFIRQRSRQLLSRPCPTLTLKQIREGDAARAHLLVPLAGVADSDAPESSAGRLLSSFRPAGPEADDEDRSRWREFCISCCTLALDYRINASEDSLERAAQLIRCWFLDPQSSLVPAFSMGRLRGTGELREIGKSAITELRDLPPLLDALRLVRQSGILLSFERQCLEEWFCHLLLWLASDTEAVLAEARAVDVQVWLHLLLAVVAAFVGKRNIIAQVLDNLPLLVARQFTPAGDFARVNGQRPDREAQLLALHGWAQLARFCSSLGWDLLCWHGQHGHSLRAVFLRHWPSVGTRRKAESAELASVAWPLMLRGLDAGLRLPELPGAVAQTLLADLIPPVQSRLPLYWSLAVPDSGQPESFLQA